MAQPPSPAPAAEAVDWEQVARRGQEYCDQHLQARLEPAHVDLFVVIDVDTGDYYLRPTPEAALDTALRHRPGGRLYLTRVGHPAAFKLLPYC